MSTAPSVGFEGAVMAFYGRNLAVALPLTILILKLTVRFVTREAPKDIFKSILVLPLDLIYVAFGLLLSGIARRIPAFTAHYGSDKEADFAGMVLCVVLFVAACLITWMDRSVRTLWQKFYAAWTLTKQVQASGNQMLLPGQPNVKKETVVYLWMFVYWSFMIPTILVECLISVCCLGAIVARIQ